MALFRLPVALLVVIIFAFEGRAATAPLDSIGTEQLNGRRYVLYKVEQGQTLYSLLRRYRTSMTDFEAANPGAEKEVKINQIIRLPYPGPRSRPQAAVQATPQQGEAARKSTTARHTVLQGETLYAIARRYAVSPGELKKWNNLPPTGELRIGQVLIIRFEGGSRPPAGVLQPQQQPTPHAAAAPVQQQETPARQVTVSPAETRPGQTTPTPVETAARTEPLPARTEPPKSEPERPEQVEAPRRTEQAAAPVARPVEQTAAPARPAARSDAPARPATRSDAPVRNASAGRKQAETGLCELIAGSEGSEKYLALHRTAPVGTMLTVRNEVNNQTVMAKVVGRLPDTGYTDRVVVRLSARAFERLNPTDRRIRTEVSYFVQ